MADLKIFVDINEPAAAVSAQLLGRRGKTKVIFHEGHIVQCDISKFSTAVLMARTPGFWSHRVESVRGDMRIDLRRITSSGPLHWWHKDIGITTSDLTRGAGVTIGVIDYRLMRTPSDQSIDHVEVLGEAATPDWQCPDDGYLPEHYHGNAVVSLIFSRSTSKDGAQGIAPGARGLFMSGWAPESRGGGREALSVGRIAHAITFLAEEKECDIITVSAGDGAEPEPLIHEAVQLAQEHGVLCFFAAGNEGGRPAYPARYPEILAVAALGRRGIASPGSLEEAEDLKSETLIDDLYLWDDSARGIGVEFIAPGSNVFWDHAGTVARGLNGSSFSSPVAAGTAAVILSGTKSRWAHLPRSKERWNTMLSILREHSFYDQSFDTVAKYGFLKVP